MAIAAAMAPLLNALTDGVLPALAVQVVWTLGLGMLAATVNVFFRDVGQLVNVGLLFWFWLTPIVYPATVLPAWALPAPSDGRTVFAFPPAVPLSITSLPKPAVPLRRYTVPAPPVRVTLPPCAARWWGAPPRA